MKDIAKLYLIYADTIDRSRTLKSIAIKAVTLRGLLFIGIIRIPCVYKERTIKLS